MSKSDANEIEDPELRALYQRAERARVLKERAEAAALFQAFVDAAPPSVWRTRAATRLLLCLSGQRLWAEQEAVARRHIDLSAEANGWIHHFLGEAELHQGRQAEALATLRQALEINPALTETRTLIAVAKAPRIAGAGTVARWPSRQDELADLRGVVRDKLLGGAPRERFIRPDSVFVTLGSCFALNLANALQKAGREAHCEVISEEVNSPLANRCLVDWLIDGPRMPETLAMEEALGEPLRERMRGLLAKADVVVLTMGVAPSFFSRETGEFVFVQARGPGSVRHLLSTAEMRTPSAAEAADHLAQVGRGLRRLAAPGARVVVTESPVPLAYTNEFGSVFIADCLSKSTLRLACHQATSDPANELLYWPSFEIVRWLGGHLGNGHPPAFGADDDNTRHVSAWLVDLIISEFLDFYAAEPGG